MGFALRNGEGFADVVDACYSQLAKRDRRVRKRSRRLVRLLISFKPRRSASLIRSFKLALRVLRNRSSAAATSSSSVKVVLTHQDMR